MTALASLGVLLGVGAFFALVIIASILLDHGRRRAPIAMFATSFVLVTFLIAFAVGYDGRTS